MTSPLTLLRERLPALFDRGVALLREKASAGGAAAQARLEDVMGAKGAVRIVLEGDGEAWIAVGEGSLTVGDAAPEGLPVRLAVAVPAEAARAAAARLPAGVAEDEGAALHVAGAASRRAEAVLEGQRLDFHVVVEGVPELDRVVAKVAVGAPEPPETPRFTATVRYDDLEDAGDRGVDPQQFLMGGRIRFAGDYVPALQLGMQLAQVMQPPRR
ncbi:MAG: hypothetical protein ACOC97_05355 [Myxococcota bacterium]